MDWLKGKEKLPAFIKKYKYVFLVIAIGLALMLLPSVTEKETEVRQEETLQQDTPTVEERLSQVLGQIKGAGRVEVMLTIARGSETFYQTDDDITTGTDSGSTRADTVTVTDADRNEAGLIRQINPPVYQGAVVVCEGADDPNVCLAVVQAVSNATGLGADKISVLKMK